MQRFLFILVFSLTALGVRADTLVADTLNNPQPIIPSQELPIFEINWQASVDESFLVGEDGSRPSREATQNGEYTSHFGLYLSDEPIDGELVLGYQASNGERLLILGASDEKGFVNFRVLGYESSTKSVDPIVTFATVHDNLMLTVLFTQKLGLWNWA